MSGQLGLSYVDEEGDTIVLSLDVELAEVLLFTRNQKLPIVHVELLVVGGFGTAIATIN